jgi:hypothetical protein
MGIRYFDTAAGTTEVSSAFDRVTRTVHECDVVCHAVIFAGNIARILSQRPVPDQLLFCHVRVPSSDELVVPDSYHTLINGCRTH